MLHADIPLKQSKQNGHAMPVVDNANSNDLQWEQQHRKEAVTSLPWHSPLFWGGVMSSVWFAGMVVWVIWSALASAVKNDWVEKPAKAHEVRQLHESMSRIEQRVEGNAAKTDARLDRQDEKLDHITDLLIQGTTSGRPGKEASK
jgi:hypothetical protein